MRIGLVDLYTNGHHLPYAARMQQNFAENSGHDVRFITVSETSRTRKLFNQNKVVYLDDPDSPPVEERDTGFDKLAEKFVDDLFSRDLQSEFDFLHFLFSDDILGPLLRHSPKADRTQVIGELNGVFFERKLPLRRRRIHPAFLMLLRSSLGNVIDNVLPEHTEHEQLWRDLHLYRCLKKEVFDHLIVHSKEAHAYVSSLESTAGTPITRIPYPAPMELGLGLSKSEARKQLNIPLQDSILLFFGTLRDEKGIHRLLRVLRKYRGPEFTVYIAGPPVDVTKAEVLSVRESSSLKIITDLEYVEGPELYFRASDALILPYTREFGRECTSQTLEEASSSLLPVMVPDFGAVGRVTEEWELGITYERHSDEALEGAMSQFACGGVQHSEEKMKQYNRLHSYENAVEALCSIYC